MVRQAAVIVGALAIAMILAGCGGSSGDDEGTASAPIGKAEFIRQADALCTKGGEETEAEFVSYAKEKKVAKGKALNQAQSEEVIQDIVVPALRQQVSDLRALGVPTEDQAQVNGFLDEIEVVLDKAEEDPKAAVKVLGEEIAKADQQIAGYFKVCGQKK